MDKNELGLGFVIGLGAATLCVVLAALFLISRYLEQEEDHPKIVALPPMVLLALVILGLVLHWLWPIHFIPRIWSVLSGSLILGLAITIFHLARKEFQEADTNINPLKHSSTIVTTGPFRFSRNPFYIGLLLFQLGLGLVLGNCWILIFTVPFFFLLHYGVVIPEEIYLEAKFGADYSSYKGSVRRWV